MGYGMQPFRNLIPTSHFAHPWYLCVLGDLCGLSVAQYLLPGGELVVQRGGSLGHFVSQLFLITFQLGLQFVVGH